MKDGKTITKVQIVFTLKVHTPYQNATYLRTEYALVAPAVLNAADDHAPFPVTVVYSTSAEHGMN